MSGFFLAEIWAPLLLLPPLVWAALRRGDARRTARLEATLGPRWRTSVPELSLAETAMARRLAVVGLAAAVLSIMQPTWGEGTRRVEQRGVDVVVCLDVSRSMLARDVAPARLEHARAEIAALAREIRFDRLALVAFAGDARVVCPLTRDMKSFERILAEVDELTVARGGSDLGAALEAAYAMLEGSSGDHEAVVLVTDGEDREGRARGAAGTLARAGIALHCVGIGSSAGGKIPVVGDGGESYLADVAGRDVVSTRDASGLGALADATGGALVDGNARGALMGLHRRSVREMARKAIDSETVAVRANRYRWPLLLAVLLWTAELALTARRRSR